MEKNKRILVTGGTGFIGSNLVNLLHSKGFEHVMAVGSKDYNLMERSQVADLFAACKPEIVIHLAAKVGGIDDIKTKPAEYYYENMLMCTYVLDECKNHGVEKIVAIGTNCSYPPDIDVPFKEADLFNGYPQKVNASYGMVKRAFYQQCVSYKQQYGTDFIYLIPTNAYGVDDHFDEASGHVIPAMIKKFANAVKTGTKVTLWGRGIATREFMYIDDVSESIFRALTEYNGDEPLNIGTGVETSIRELAETIAGLIGYDKEIIWDVDKPEGYLRKCLDSSNMKACFGEVTFTSLYDGLKRTIEWAKETGII